MQAMRRWVGFALGLVVVCGTVGCVVDWDRYTPLPPSAGRCGGTSVLADNFDDGVSSTEMSFGACTGSVCTETGGEQVIQLPSGAGSWVGARTDHLYDLRSDRVLVEVPTVPNTATVATAWLRVIFDDNNLVSLSETQGSLKCGTTVDGHWVDIASRPYDPVADRWWQIREQDGTLYWETSPDGVSFVERVTWPVAQLFPVDLIRVEIGASTEATESNPGEAHFDNLNGGGPPTGVWCPMSQIVDDFGDGKQGRIWARSWQDPGCTAAEQDGKLRFSLSTDGTTGASGAYNAGSRHDLTEGQALVEVPTLPAVPNVWASLTLKVDNDHSFWMEYGSSALTCRLRQGADTQAFGSSVTLAGEHRWWRLREQAGIIYCETAPDGRSWTERGHVQSPFAVTALDLSLSAGVGGTEPLSATVEYDNFDLPP